MSIEQPVDQDAPSTGVILCVEDEDDLLTEMQEQLEDFGYTILTAHDGNEALSVIADRTPDLILTDIAMPGMDGYELLDRIRLEHPDLNEVPIIFLTSYGSSIEEIRGKVRGADDYLSKPIEFDLVRATIDARLRQIRIIRESVDRRIAEARARIDRIILEEEKVISRIEREVREPLNIIVGYSSMLLQGLLGEITDQSHLDYLRMINKSGKNLADRTRELCTMARVVPDSPNVELASLVIGEVVGEAILQSRWQLQERRITPTVKGDDKLKIVADRTKIRKAVFNMLFGMAQELEPESALDITYGQGAEGEFAIRFCLAEMQEGVGKICSALLGDTAIDRQSATMIGLAAAREMIALHGGQIRYEAVLDRRPTFIIELPESPVSQVAANPHDPAP